MRRTAPTVMATRSLIVEAVSAMLVLLVAGRAVASGSTARLSIGGTANCTADSGREVHGVCVLLALSVDQGAELFIASSGGGGSIALWHFDLVAGSLPPGMSMPALYGHGDHSTIIAGTPRAQGTFVFTVKLTDGRGDTATGRFSLTVHH
jgi:Putative Ig domain